MSNLLAIDPGNTESGWVVIDGNSLRPVRFGKTPNDVLLGMLGDELYGFTVIEMIASYGMAVGAEVFDTCVWIGRFVERLDAATLTAQLVKRLPVKVHHCHSSKASDSNVRQALVDRFAPGAGNHGKGTKAQPGWFHGFHADVWQAYALAVYAADTLTTPCKTNTEGSAA